MKIRPASGMGVTLEDAMKKVVTINDRHELLDYLRQNYEWMNPTFENTTVKYYGYDDRIDWDTWLVCVDGKAVLFADSPIQIKRTTITELMNRDKSQG